MGKTLGYEDVKGSWVEFLTRYLTDAHYRMYVLRDERIFKRSRDDMVGEGYLACLELFITIVVDLGVYAPHVLANELEMDLVEVVRVASTHEPKLIEELPGYPPITADYNDIQQDFHKGALSGSWKTPTRKPLNDWSLVA